MVGRRLKNDWNEGLPSPGDYWLADGCWFGCTPNGLVANLSHHDVVEHPDRTITVLPSILCSQPDGPTWHGFLERGVWQQV